MDLSSDPFYDPLGSSPPPIEPMVTGEEARACPNPTPPTIPTIPTSRVGLGLSSSPDFTLDNPFSSGGLSASTHRPTQQPRKRGLQTRDYGPAPKEPRTQDPQDDNPQDPSGLTRSKILEARDLILQACSITKSRDEQSRLLDLLEIFREYTEKGRLTKSSNIIASQVANLETAVRKIETKAKTLTGNPTPPTPPTRTPLAILNPTKPNSYA